MQVEYKTEKGTVREIWKDIEGQIGRYQISNIGNVKSLDRVVFNNGSKLNGNRKGVILKKSINGAGYLYVNFWIDGRNKSIRIHRLVAAAFCFGYENGLHVNHKDGNKLNNHFSNLEWCTPSHNIRHAIRTGLNPRGKGDKSNHKIVSEYDVLKIRFDYLNGISQKDIALNYPQISAGTVKNILGRRTWKHI